MEADWWARGVALAGVGLAAGSLWWQTKDRARLTVQASTAIVGLNGDTMTVIEIAAVNNGKRPTTVTNLTLIAGDPPKWRYLLRPIIRLLPTKLRRWAFPSTAQLVSNENPIGADTPIPHHLGVGDRAVKYYRWDWVVERGAEHDFDRVHALANCTTARGFSRPVKFEN